MAAREALKIQMSDPSDTGSGRVRQSDSTFDAWIKSRKLTKQRAYEVIGIAKGYLAIPAAQRKSYLALGKYKALKLASIEPEALSELAEQDPDLFDEVALLSRSELAAKLENLAVQLKTEQEKNKKAPLKPRAPVSPFLPRTEDIRAECRVFQKESELTLNSLRKLFEEVNSDPHALEWRYQIEQIWLTANIAAAHAAGTLHVLREACAVGDLPDSVQSPHMMTPQEAKHWLQDAALIEGAYAGKKAAREDEREQAKPKKAGRPKNPQTGDAK